MIKYPDFSELKGKTLTRIEVRDDEICFYSDENRIYVMYHKQDCCETVVVDDVCGEIENIIGSPITLAEERSNEQESLSGSETWTFYEIATAKGAVTIRWHGSSNGYYSESVYFKEIDDTYT